MSLRSTSVKVTWPVALMLEASSPSDTAPDCAPLVITGASLVPVIVTLITWLAVPSNEVTASDLIASMNHALAANLVPHELALLEKRMRDLNNMMSSVKAINKGSVVYLDYIPDVGTRVVINGEEKMTIPGDDFFRALLQIWIGNKPVDGRLRDAMLGGKSRGLF